MAKRGDDPLGLSDDRWREIRRLWVRARAVATSAAKGDEARTAFLNPQTVIDTLIEIQRMYEGYASHLEKEHSQPRPNFDPENLDGYHDAHLQDTQPVRRDVKAVKSANAGADELGHYLATLKPGHRYTALDIFEAVGMAFATLLPWTRNLQRLRQDLHWHAGRGRSRKMKRQGDGIRSDATIQREHAERRWLLESYQEMRVPKKRAPTAGSKRTSRSSQYSTWELQRRRVDPNGAAHPLDAHVFGNAVGEKLDSIKTAWRATCRRAKIDGLHFHDLRREAACRWYEAGVPLHHIRDLLGHADISTTSRYLAVTPTELQRSLR